MSLTLLANPNKIIDNLTSNVNAAISQLPYTFLREDIVEAAGTIDNNGGLVRCTITPDATTLFSVGDTVFFSGTPDPSNVAPQVTTITTVNANNVTMDIPFGTGTVVGYSFNLLTTRPDYSIQIIIENLDTSTQGNTFVYKPAQNGDLFVDIGEIVVTEMENNQTPSMLYRIKYRENYSGIDDPFVNDVSIQAILGERGIGQVAGSNLWEYVLNEHVVILATNILNNGGNINVSTTQAVGKLAIGDTVRFNETAGDYSGMSGRVSNVQATFIGVDITYIGDLNQQFNVIRDGALFLTNFKGPQLWTPFKQTVPFVMDSNYGTRTGSAAFRLKQTYKDINGVTISSEDSTGEGDLSARIVNQLIDVSSIPSGTDSIRLSVWGAFQFTKTLDYHIAPNCQNPIGIEWLNSLGGTEFYVFEISQEVRYGVVGETVYSPAVDGDIANVFRQNVRINSDQTLRIICTAENVLPEDIRALHEMKTAEFVNVYLNADGSDVIGVIVTSALESGYASDDITSSFAVAIDFPEDYNFFDIKTY